MHASRATQRCAGVTRWVVLLLSLTGATFFWWHANPPTAASILLHRHNIAIAPPATVLASEGAATNAAALARESELKRALFAAGEREESLKRVIAAAEADANVAAARSSESADNSVRVAQQRLLAAAARIRTLLAVRDETIANMTIAHSTVRAERDEAQAKHAALLAIVASSNEHTAPARPGVELTVEKAPTESRLADASRAAVIAAWQRIAHENAAMTWLECVVAFKEEHEEWSNFVVNIGAHFDAHVDDLVASILCTNSTAKSSFSQHPGFAADHDDTMPWRADDVAGSTGFVTPMNVGAVLLLGGVPDEPLLFKIDIDGYDVAVAIAALDFRGTPSSAALSEAKKGAAAAEPRPHAGVQQTDDKLVRGLSRDAAFRPKFIVRLLVQMIQ